MTSMRVNWRLASRLSVIVLALLVVLIVTVVQRNAASVAQPQPATNDTTNSTTQGTDLGGVPAPNFQLTDQYGKQVSLAQFKGKPVVLTFLYTHCPDVCPLTAERLHTTMQQLGSQAQDVGVIAVSTDPKGDTMDAALKFSQAHNMQSYWHYLIGTQQTLSPVWSNYNIFAQAQKTNVNHSMAVYVIDKQGKERTYFDSSFTSDQLTTSLKQLLKA